MENTPVDNKRIDEDGEVLDERAEERGDALVGEVKGNDDDEMFEEAVDDQQLPQEEEEAKLNYSFGSIDLDVNGGASVDGGPDGGNQIAAYDETDSFEEALGTPTAAASSVDGGRSEEDFPTTAADEKEEVEEVGVEKEAEGQVGDDSMKKLQVAPPKVESFEEAIVAPTVAANVIDEGGTKEETGFPSSADYNGHLETGSKEMEEVGVDEEARDGIGELDEKLQVSSVKAESFEEAIGTPTVMASVAGYEWSKEENSPDNSYESYKENHVKLMEGVDESTEKLQVSFEKTESFEEAIGTPSVLASIAAEEWSKEENPPDNGHESHKKDDVKEKEGVDELTEKLQVSSEKAESFEEAIGTPTILASIAAEEWSREEAAPDNGHESHKEDDVKEIAGADESTEKLQVSSEKAESFEEAIGTPTILASIAAEEWSREEEAPDNGHESHREDDVKEIASADESTEKLEVSFEKAENFEEAIGTPTVLTNVVDEEWSKEENLPSEGLKEADLKETEEGGADKETKDSEIKGVGARNYVEEATDKSVPDKGLIRNSEDVAGKNQSNLAVENQEVEVASRDFKAVENHINRIEANGHVNGEVRVSESPDLAPRDADNAKELKDEEQKDVSSVSAANHQDDSNGYVKTALSGTKFNDGEKSVEDGTMSPEIDGLANSGKAANVKLEKIEHADRSINAAPVLRKKDDSTEKVNKVELPPLKQMNQAPARPAGLGRAAPLLEPAPRAAAQQPRGGGSVSQAQPQQIEEAVNTEAEEYDETREKLQMIRVKFLRLAHRLGQTPHNVVVAQVLYRLGLAEQLRGRNGGRVGAFSFDRASAMAEQLEASGQDPLDFSCTIMVLGKSGVGKSATINSIFDEAKLNTDAFGYGTKKVQDVVGTVQGIRVRVIDTPGLFTSGSDQRHNEKILHSVKRFIKKTPPDIILYLDRLDVQSIDLSDMPLLRTITDIFGASIWFNAIVVLTHAASAPPEGPNGVASSYDMFVTQRSHVVQQAIRQAAGDMRLMNPVSLVENHSACRTNRAGQRVLPNGQVWKPHLLLLSFASKILAEANTLLKLQDSPPGRAFTARPRMPPLPYLLSSLLQPRATPKLPQEQQYGDEDAVDYDDDSSSSDSEEVYEYDELPPFKRLTKAQLSKLSKAQKNAYFEELEYREKLFMTKQDKEDRKQRRMMKKMAAAAKDNPAAAADFPKVEEEEAGGAASVPVPMPDLALPASFDSDNPTHRYRYLDTSNQWLVRPVLETHGWDHDIGYEGINVERLFVVKDKVPVSFSGQVTKDKKDANVQMEVASSIKHGEGKGTSVGFDMQTVGKELAYTIRSETKLSNHRRNKASAGLSMTLMHDAVSAGFKIEDKLILNRCFRMLLTAGAITARGDVAYGGSLDATWKDKDPLGRFQSTLGLSVMDWHGDLAIGGNVQSQIPLGRTTNLIARANLNNRGAGQVSVRVNSSEQLQIVLVALVPMLKKLFDYTPRQLQFGFGQ